MTRIRPAAPPSPSPPSPTASGFSLAGPSRLPDPRFAAYRKDLADIALAGRVISSHYAEPLARTLIAAATLHAAADQASPPLAGLEPGAAFGLLDCSRGWAWGYAGPRRLVGYIRAGALGME